MKPSAPLSPILTVLTPAIRQSGIAVAFAIMLGYAVNRVYDDLGRRNEVLVDLVTKQVQSSQSVSDSLERLAVSIEHQSGAVDRLERAISKNP